MSGHVQKSVFANLYGCSRAYVSQLIAAGRLVLSADGKLVDVDASLERLGATADPSKAGVRERWEAYRAEQSAAATPAAAAPAPVQPVQPAPAAARPPAPPITAAPSAEQPAPTPHPSQRDDAPTAPTAPTLAPAPSPARSDYQDARALREKAEAEMAQIELRKIRGMVLEVEPTLRAVVDAHMAVRGELLGLADRVAPLVAAETNPRRVWELIQAEAELLCERMQRAAQQLAERSRAEVTA